MRTIAYLIGRVDDHVSDSDEAPRSGGKGDVPVSGSLKDKVIVFCPDGGSSLYDVVSLVSVSVECVSANVWESVCVFVCTIVWVR